MNSVFRFATLLSIVALTACGQSSDPGPTEPPNMPNYTPYGVPLGHEVHDAAKPAPQPTPPKSGAEPVSSGKVPIDQLISRNGCSVSLKAKVTSSSVAADSEAVTYRIYVAINGDGNYIVKIMSIQCDEKGLCRYDQNSAMSVWASLSATSLVLRNASGKPLALIQMVKSLDGNYETFFVRAETAFFPNNFPWESKLEVASCSSEVATLISK